MIWLFWLYWLYFGLSQKNKETVPIPRVSTIIVTGQRLRYF